MQLLFPLYENGKWRDRPMRVTTLDSWASSFSAIMKKPFYWHSLRHFFTTRLAESNLPDNVIQDIVGWQSADMVRIYDDATKESKFDKYFGAGGIRDVKKASLTEL